MEIAVGQALQKERREELSSQSPSEREDAHKLKVVGNGNSSRGHWLAGASVQTPPAPSERPVTLLTAVEETINGKCRTNEEWTWHLPSA